jgi:hypothetical protein
LNTGMITLEGHRYLTTSQTECISYNREEKFLERRGWVEHFIRQNSKEILTYLEWEGCRSLWSVREIKKENVIIIKNKNKCLEKMNIRVLYSKEPQVMGLYIRDEENKKAYQHWIKGPEYELAQVELKELREEFRQSLSISGDEKNNLDLIKDGRIFVFNEYSLNEIYSEGSKAKCDVSYENKDYKVGQFAIWYSYND